MKKLVVLFGFTLLATWAYAQERGFTLVPKQDKSLALVIGNGTYQYGGSLGTQPLNDARDMKTMLEKLGFEVILLLNGTMQQMNEKIDAFGSKLPYYKVGFFYYAGHGLQINGENYLVPVDGKIESESDAKYRCVPAGLALGKMHDAQNALNMVVLDACRDNPFERKWTGRSNSNGSGLAQMDSPRGTFISFATSPGSTASNGTGRNGLYTSVLLRYMNQPGLKLEDVFKNVRAEVLAKSGNKQLTWESSSVIGDFYFAGKANNNTTVSNNTTTNNSDWGEVVEVAKYGNLKITTEAAGTLHFANEQGVYFAANTSRTRQKIKTGTYTYTFETESGTRQGTVTITENGTAEIAIQNTARLNADFNVSLAGLSIAMRGTFTMGSSSGSSDETPHTVTVGNFAMSKYEVTFAQYDAFCAATGRRKPDDKGWGRGNRPVINVSWGDATAYAQWLSQKTGETWRLPTEAEWEYAARGGENYQYAGSDNLDEVAWHSGNSGEQTQPVGGKKPNSFGLYDMSGNVWEWCADWYGSDYYAKTKGASNPQGPETGLNRVLRGGSWNSNAGYCRAANRNSIGPGYRNSYLGFRLVFVP